MATSPPLRPTPCPEDGAKAVGERFARWLLDSHLTPTPVALQRAPWEATTACRTFAQANRLFVLICTPTPSIRSWELAVSNGELVTLQQIHLLLVGNHLALHNFDRRSLNRRLSPCWKGGLAPSAASDQ